jgi:hypothetical protein
MRQWSVHAACHYRFCSGRAVRDRLIPGACFATRRLGNRPLGCGDFEPGVADPRRA